MPIYTLGAQKPARMATRIAAMFVEAGFLGPDVAIVPVRIAVCVDAFLACAINPRDAEPSAICAIEREGR